MWVNNVVLGGILIKDDELKTSQTGKSFYNFSLFMANTIGEKEQKQYVSCVAFGKTAEFISNRENKQKLILEGELDISSYEKDGVKKYSTKLKVQRAHLA